MRPDRPSLQSVFSRVVWAIALSLARTADLVNSGCAAVWRSVRRLIQSMRGLSASGKRRTTELLSGPVKEFVVGPLRVSLLGRRTGLSLLTALLAPAFALAAAWWVSSTVGYEALAAWVRGTWFGTDPSLAVFTAAGVLVVLGAISAAANSGILPTTVLVSAPIFGAASTRYGTTVTYTWGTEVVTLPDAVGMAAVFALGFGVPIAVAGFVLGRLLSRTVGIFRGRSGPAAPVENT